LRARCSARPRCWLKVLPAGLSSDPERLQRFEHEAQAAAALNHPNIAPLDNPNCVRTAGGRDSSFCTQSVRPTCAVKDPKTCKALHWPIPDAWTSARFNDSSWPRAIIWSAEEVTNQRAYTDYTKYFGDAEFIWTRNLHLDDLVLARYTAKGPRKK